MKFRWETRNIYDKKVLKVFFLINYKFKIVIQYTFNVVILFKIVLYTLNLILY